MSEPTWITGALPDNPEVASRTLAIRAPGDPDTPPPEERSQLSLAAMKDLAVELLILKTLRDGEPRTLHRIGVEALGKGSEVLMGTALEEALWELVLEEVLSFTVQCPVLFRLGPLTPWNPLDLNAAWDDELGVYRPMNTRSSLRAGCVNCARLLSEMSVELDDDSIDKRAAVHGTWRGYQQKLATFLPDDTPEPPAYLLAVEDSYACRTWMTDEAERGKYAELFPEEYEKNTAGAAEASSVDDAGRAMPTESSVTSGASPEPVEPAPVGHIPPPPGQATHAEHEQHEENEMSNRLDAITKNVEKLDKGFFEEEAGLAECLTFCVEAAMHAGTAISEGLDLLKAEAIGDKFKRIAREIGKFCLEDSKEEMDAISDKVEYLLAALGEVLDSCELTPKPPASASTLMYEPTFEIVGANVLDCEVNHTDGRVVIELKLDTETTEMLRRQGEGELPAWMSVPWSDGRPESTWPSVPGRIVGPLKRTNGKFNCWRDVMALSHSELKKIKGISGLTLKHFKDTLADMRVGYPEEGYPPGN